MCRLAGIALRPLLSSDTSPWWAIEQGFSPKRVQDLLGHASIQMTFDVYGHLFPSLEDDHAKFAEGEAALET
jgi:integrase